MTWSFWNGGNSFTGENAVSLGAEITTDILQKKQENAENEKQSSDLQKLMTVHFAVRKLGYFKWAVSPSTDILQFTSESL